MRSRHLDSSFFPHSAGMRWSTTYLRDLEDQIGERQSAIRDAAQQEALIREARNAAGATAATPRRQLSRLLSRLWRLLG